MNQKYYDLIIKYIRMGYAEEDAEILAEIELNNKSYLILKNKED